VSAQDNKAVIRRLVEEVYNEGNLDVVDELVAPDLFDHAAVPEHQHGIDAFKHVITWVRDISSDVHYDIDDISSDVHYDIDDIIAEGDKVAVRMTQSGTQTGPIRDIPPPAAVSRSTTSIGFVLRTERSRRCGR
jgi:predicted ester cyclase